MPERLDGRLFVPAEDIVLIERGQMIAGLEATEARSLMRILEFEAHSTSALADRCQLSEDQARALVDDLCGAGLIEATEAGSRFALGPNESIDHLPTLWRTTLPGNALAKARIGKPMTREKATTLLDELLDRVRAANGGDEWLHWITRVTLYGSLVRPEAELVGDVDVAIELTDRYEHAESLTRQDEMITRDNASPRSIIEQIGYAQLKLVRYLRGRSGRIDLELKRPGQDLPPGAVSTVVYDRTN